MDKLWSFVTSIQLLCTQLVVLLFVCCCFKCVVGNGITISNNNIMCVEEDRQALLKFKHGITYDYCGLLSSWGDTQNCCQWHGVRCDNNTGCVIKINLHGVENPFDMHHGRCLECRVSSSLVDLKHLTYLDLSLNNFSNQPIPSFIGSLVNLKHLILSDSGFEGEIPHQLGNLSSLIALDLKNCLGDRGIYVNYLSWLSRLTRFTSLTMTDVDLSRATNWLQIVNNLPFLSILQLDDSELSSPVIPRPLSFKNSPTTFHFLSLHWNKLNDSSIIFEWLFNLSGINTHLAHLDLSDNQLGCPLPSAFGNLHSLSYLDLSANQFQGNILDTISNIKPLTYLDLSINNFQSLSKTLGNLCSLKELMLDSNNLSDELPTLIQSLIGCANKSLLSLDLSYNQICGSLPGSIRVFSSLRELSLHWNKLNGSISENLGQLSLLETLYLSSNNLKGSLSNNHFSNLSKLWKLSLGNNSALTLNVSDDWLPPFQLDKINLSNFRMGPLFPKWILTQISYSKLDISFNNFEGALPSFPENVSSLHVNNNKFSNPIPLLCPKFAKKALYQLDLSNNFLSGPLPDCWMNFPQLTFLHLENNNFSGVIPSSIAYLRQLQVLHLRNNAIFGKMQSSLENLISLVFLDLGYNSLSGHISPSMCVKLGRFSILILRSNNFIGEIPSSLCQISSLQILDHSGNHNIDIIPECIRNFTTMQNSTDLLP